MVDTEYGRVMTQYWKAQARHEYWHGLYHALKQWARCECDCNLSCTTYILYC